MRRRILETLGVAAVIGLVSGITVGAQGPQAGAALKTVWGEPDLQGIWGITFGTPLQRPAKFKDKAVLTDQELKALNDAKLEKPRGFGDKRGERGTERDVAGAYDSRVFLQHRYAGNRTSLITDPPDGRLPPMTPEAQARQREIRTLVLDLIRTTESCKNKWRGCEGGAYNPVPSDRRFEPTFKNYPVGNFNRADNIEDHGLSMRCLSANMPDFISGGTGGFWQFVQSPQAVAIFYDTGQGQGWHRTIPVDGSAHLPSDITTWWGDSRGHWEGNTLVVDVSNFNGKNDFQGSREGRRFVERWTRIDAESLEYVVTVNDPTTWTKPWTAKQIFTKQSDQLNRIYKEPRCVEGNYSIAGMLGGARQKDVAYAEGRGPDPRTLNYMMTTNAALDDEDLDEFQ